MTMVFQQSDLTHVIDAETYVRKAWTKDAKVGIILGTGLGGLADQIQSAVRIPYASIPHFPRSTAMGHRGQLVCGHLADTAVVAMQGRFHLYEGYSPRQIALPVRVMRRLGASLLIVSNASGGLNPQYASGDIMLIDDHINLMFANPLMGPHDDRLGDRFPDMSAPYDPDLIERVQRIARRQDVVVHRGVYAAMKGPTYETRAEYEMLRRLGADVVGMSTVPEVLVAVQQRMRILGLSVVTNVFRPQVSQPTQGEEVVAAASSAAERMQALVHELLLDLRGQP